MGICDRCYGVLRGTRRTARDAGPPRPPCDCDPKSSLIDNHALRVDVGVSIFIVRMNETTKLRELLLGKRKGPHCPGTYGLPGGKMDYGESPLETAQRELREEVGPDLQHTPLQPLRTQPYANTVFDNGKHFITLYFVGHWLSGEPALMEPTKCEGWIWATSNELPGPLFPTLATNPQIVQAGLYVRL